ncbi:phage tail terminator protein [Photobacterium sp. 1_MG-2023]|uniref:phage tail terminator protein n=1 Tax=Photobacterium sp. 1_MG-2023 TaxID=3062646 RepID=UPI0026E28C01|nr:phage tail terminator protein [Photobacterium sp. 1_MG-2023]MDO6707923.1 phage tail terminator protein [Photobacterium sp. 1_MG-2023]
MEINNRIRKQVMSDLESGIKAQGQSMIALFCNGTPTVLQAPDPSYPEQPCDLPAIAIALAEGQSISDDFDEETWRASLIVRIYLVVDNKLDPQLDAIGQQVRNVLHRGYTADGLLTLCNIAAYDYARDDDSPWGTLDLIFTVEYNEET